VSAIRDKRHVGTRGLNYEAPKSVKNGARDDAEVALSGDSFIEALRGGEAACSCHFEMVVKGVIGNWTRTSKRSRLPGPGKIIGKRRQDGRASVDSKGKKKKKAWGNVLWIQTRYVLRPGHLDRSSGRSGSPDRV